MAAGLPSFSCWGFGRAFRQVDQAGADSGGLYPILLCHNVSQCFDQGQWVGKCRIGRRCGRASRAGTLTILRRSVDPRARVCWSPGQDAGSAQQVVGDRRTHRIQAALAPKRPEGRCARGPSIKSANTVSMMACWRWVMSACSTGRSVLVKNGWQRLAEEHFKWCPRPRPPPMTN